jgi:hypothetical protein
MIVGVSTFAVKITKYLQFLQEILAAPFLLKTSVVDPHRFQCGSGSSILVIADPDADPDPGIQGFDDQKP